MTVLAPIHPFPARMAPELATDSLNQASGHPLAILDPMCGSGTVLAETVRAGHRAIGLDSDPLAVLLSRCAINPVDGKSLRSAAQIALDLASRLMGEQQTNWPDQETERFIEYWFDHDASLELSALAQSIRMTSDRSVRQYLWCAFSRMIIVKSRGVSRAMDLSHSRPHRAYSVGPSRPFERFGREVSLVSKRGAMIQEAVGPSSCAVVQRADAKWLPLRSRSIDHVITSPPYINAIDYIRTSKFTLVWMGYSVSNLRAIRSNSVGTEAGRGTPLAASVPWEQFGDITDLSRRHQSIVARFVNDLRGVTEEIQRVLVRGGQYTIVVGNSAIRGIYIENAEIVKWALARAGLRIRTEERREIPDSRRYLPPPHTQRGQTPRMREEVVLRGWKP